MTLDDCVLLLKGAHRQNRSIRLCSTYQISGIRGLERLEQGPWVVTLANLPSRTTIRSQRLQQSACAVPTPTLTQAGYAGESPETSMEDGRTREGGHRVVGSLHDLVQVEYNKKKSIQWIKPETSSGALDC